LGGQSVGGGGFELYLSIDERRWCEKYEGGFFVVDIKTMAIIFLRLAQQSYI